MKADIFLSIRNKATRLPGKVLMEVNGQTLTEHLIQRLKNSRKFSQIVMCTSTNNDDDKLVEIAKKNSIEYFRGSEEDKLYRYLRAAEEFKTDFIVVVDGDDIFCEPLFIDGCINLFENSNADYITVKDAPLGVAPFCIKKEALETVCKIKKEKDTEVWGGYFTQTNIFKTEYLEIDEKLRRPEIRLTLDYKEDFDLIQEIFTGLSKHSKDFTIYEIVDFLNKNPNLVKINQDAHKWYLSNLQKSASVKI